MKDIRDGFLELLKKYKSNKSIYFLSIDQGFLLREDFKKISKDRFIDVSISEQNSILIAAGLALNNKKVFIFGINSFLIKRCFEQIYLYMFNMNLDINLICSGPGYSYSGDGVSHFSLDDLGLLKNYKNIKIYHPSNYETSKFSSLEMISSKNPTVIRLDKGEYEFIRHDKKKSLKNGFIIQKKLQSSKTLIISYGVTSTYIKDLNHNINVFRINLLVKLINLINFFKGYHS